MTSTKTRLSVTGGADSIAISNDRGETLGIFATCDESTRQLAHRFVRVANEADELNDVLDLLIDFVAAERDVFVQYNGSDPDNIEIDSRRVWLRRCDSMLERARGVRTRLNAGE